MASETTPKNDATMLDSNFTPCDKDVLVGRGKVCYRHSGNQRLANLVKSVLNTYSDPQVSKKGKTELIKSIVDKIRESSPGGGFVKFDEKTGCWYEVGNKLAREKVSQTFRDCLTDNYKSSTTSKTLRRRQQRINRQTSAGSTKSQGSTASLSFHSYQRLSSPFVAAAPPVNVHLPSLSRVSIASSLSSKSYPYSLGLANQSQALESNPCLQMAIVLAERKRSLQNLLLANNCARR